MHGFESAIDLIRAGGGTIGTSKTFGVLSTLLGFVFLAAGVAKLRRLAVAALAMVDFDVVSRARPAYGVALGAIEFAIAIALITRSLPSLALVVAAILLSVFALLIGRSLKRGERFPCTCFGASMEPLSKLTFVRTFALACVALLLLGFAVFTGERGSSGSAAHIIEAIVAVSALSTIVLISSIVRLALLSRQTLASLRQV
jgi:Methylamine utilisation protein MauE